MKFASRAATHPVCLPAMIFSSLVAPDGLPVEHSSRFGLARPKAATGPG